MQKKTKQLQVILLCCFLVLPGFLRACSGKEIEEKSIDSNTDNEAFIQDEQEPRDEVTSPTDKSSKLTDKELLGSKIKRCQTLNKRAENQENEQKDLYNAQDYPDHNQLANSLPNILSNNNISSLSPRRKSSFFAQNETFSANLSVESTKEERLKRFQRLVKEVRFFKHQLQVKMKTISVKPNKKTAKLNRKKNKNRKILKELLSVKEEVEKLFFSLSFVPGNLESIENSENVFGKIKNKYYHIIS